MLSIKAWQREHRRMPTGYHVGESILFRDEGDEFDPESREGKRMVQLASTKFEAEQEVSGAGPPERRRRR